MFPKLLVVGSSVKPCTKMMSLCRDEILIEAGISSAALEMLYIVVEFLLSVEIH